MRKYSQGIYEVQNPGKYAGNSPPTYRSSWEHVFCRFCDNHPAVISWASEPVKIPYKNPLTGRGTVYVPDFVVIYQDKNGKQHGEMIEIKPLKETTMENAGRSKIAQARVIVNHAKWEAASIFCKKNGLVFRVVNENDIFSATSKQPKRRK